MSGVCTTCHSKEVFTRCDACVEKMVKKAVDAKVAEIATAFHHLSREFDGHVYDRMGVMAFSTLKSKFLIELK